MPERCLPPHQRSGHPQPLPVATALPLGCHTTIVILIAVSPPTIVVALLTAIVVIVVKSEGLPPPPIRCDVRVAKCLEPFVHNAQDWLRQQSLRQACACRWAVCVSEQAVSKRKEKGTHRSLPR
jgi:hypothetical protein